VRIQDVEDLLEGRENTLMLKAFTIAGWILAFPLLSAADALVGRVQDPQQRVIRGAEATLTCGQHEERVTTDSTGRFRFPARPSFNRCSLVVSHPGFENSRQTLSEAPEPFTIELRLAMTKQVLDVYSDTKDLRETTLSSLGSASISARDLRGISNSTLDLISYAKAVAGADSRTDAIYVDDLPSTTLPPPEMVARINVNTDPFSAEYSDNDQTHINIVTKNADRKLRFNLGGAGVGFGGGNSLAPGLRSASHSTNLSLSGPVPYSPLTFSLIGSLGSFENDQPIEAVIPPGLPVAIGSRIAPATSHNGSGQLNLHYSRAESSQADFSYSDSRSTASNVGVGGLTLPEAGSDSNSSASEVRLTFSKAASTYIYRGGLVLDQKATNLQANSTDLGLTVAGSFTAGGAAVASNQSRETNWTWKNVVQSSSKKRSWTTGVTLTRIAISSDEQPNPNGAFEFSSLQAYSEALAGQPTGTWFLTKGNGNADYATVEAAPFLQGELFHSDRLLVTGGVRADYQAGGGVLWSPRLSAASRVRGFIVRAGGGQFVHDWPANVFLRILQDDGLHLEPYILQNASLLDALTPAGADELVGAGMVRAKLAPDLTRPQDWMFKTSIEHPLGHLTPGLEYTWTDGLHLLGSERLPDQQAWMDVLESNRARRREQLHARLRYTWRKQTIVGHYEWIHSLDNTSGAFSFPEVPNDLAGEWARTAGISPHNFSVIDSVRLPGGVSATLIATTRSSAPYNITSGLDTGDGLYNDRGGRPRNSGNGPGYRSLAAYGSRRLALPGFTGKSGERVYITVGVRADNLLGNKNYLGLDSVSSSPLFGMPLAASPGRSVRFWCSLL